MAAVGIGSVAVGPRQDTAALSKNCSMYLASARAHRHAGDLWWALGYYDQANVSYGLANQYYGLLETYC